MANPGKKGSVQWVLFVISWNKAWCRWPSCISNWWRKACHRYLAPPSHSDVGGSHESFVWVLICLHSDGFTCKEIYVIQTDGGWDLMHDLFWCQVHLSGFPRWIAVRFFKLTVYQVFCALQKTTVEFCNMYMIFVPLVSYQTCVVLFLNFVETLCYGEVSLPSGMHWMLGGSVKSQT